MNVDEAVTYPSHEFQDNSLWVSCNILFNNENLGNLGHISFL